MSDYLAASTLTRLGDGHRLGLETALGMTPQGVVDHPTFFSGFVDRADVTASGILAVADVAGTRYADVGLAQRLANLDPVVTAGGDRLRFESFSACNGVYARLDLLPDGLGSAEVGFGTTNVDVNQPLRTALAGVGRHEPLHLAVGGDELRAALPDRTHVERKVALPDRWVRGLAEVPTLLSEMRLVGSLESGAATTFLASMPRQQGPGPDLWVLPAGTTWRTATREVPRSFPLAGASRLSGSARVARFTRRLTAYHHPHGSSAWVYELPGARLTLAVSPGAFRGFSGEGTLLNYLVRPEAERWGRLLLDRLGWSGVVDPRSLASDTGLSDGEVDTGLAWLAASGRLGYDVTEGAWFHRELPVDADAVLRRNPRVTSAQRLVESGRIAAVGEAAWQVPGSKAETYQVRADRTRIHCTCRWEQEHAGTRGPCKHALAVMLMLRQDATGTPGRPGRSDG